MDIIEQFQACIAKGRFRDALPLIREIVQRAPKMPTSHFNLGVCLDGLGDHREASRAFLRAYELAPDDGAALFRACRTLANGNLATELFGIFQRECARDPAMIHAFVDTPEFERFFALPAFRNLRDEFIVE